MEVQENLEPSVEGGMYVLHSDLDPYGWIASDTTVDAETGEVHEPNRP